ncbi:unnamed protein product, partial [marine sediment metagenome]
MHLSLVDMARRAKYSIYTDVWSTKEIRFYFIYGLIMLFLTGMLDFITNWFLNRAITILYGGLLITIPIWVGIYYKIKEQRRIKINGK